MSDLASLLAQLSQGSSKPPQQNPGQAQQSPFAQFNMNFNQPPPPQQQNNNPFAALQLPQFNPAPPVAAPPPQMGVPPQAQYQSAIIPPPQQQHGEAEFNTQLPQARGAPPPQQLPNFGALPKFEPVATAPPPSQPPAFTMPPPQQQSGFMPPQQGLAPPPQQNAFMPPQQSAPQPNMAQFGMNVPAAVPPAQDEPKEKRNRFEEMDGQINVEFVEFAKHADFTILTTVQWDPASGKSIQSMIDNVKNGTCIEIPEGNYTEELTIIKSIMLRGLGRVTITGTGVSDTICTSNQFIVLENINLVQIDTRGGGALTIQSGYLKATDCSFDSVTISAVQVVGDSYGEFTNCTFVNSYNPAIMLTDKAQACCVNCTLRGSRTFGALANDNSYLTLNNCHASKNGSSGVSATGAGNLLIIGGTYFDNESSGIEVTSQGSITIQHATICDHENGTGVLAQGPDVKVLLVESTLKNNQLAGVKVSDSAKLISKHNNYSDAKQNVIAYAHQKGHICLDTDHFSGECIAAVATSDEGRIDAKNIDIMDISNAAILCYDDGEINIDGANITNCEHTALQFRDRAKFYIKNVNITGIKDLAAAILNDSVGKMKDCRIINGQTVGLELTSVKDVKIKRCVFSNNGVCGASVHDDVDCKFIDCSFDQNGQFGVDTSSENVNAKFLRCKFTGSPEAVINITNGATSTFEECVISDAPKIGLSVIKAAPTFKGCEITRIDVAAISCSGGATPTFENCNVHDNANFAAQVHQPKTHARFVETFILNHSKSVAIIALNGAVAEFVRTKFENSFQPHCEIRDGATVNLHGCDIGPTDNGTGIQVHNDGILQVDSSRIHELSKIGIFVGDKGLAEIKNSAIEHCGQAGIVVGTGGRMNISKSILDGNGQLAMQFLPSVDATVTECVIQNHTMFGFVMARGANVEYSENQFSNNGQKDIYIN